MNEDSTEKTYQLDPILAPFIKLLGVGMVLLVFTLTFNVPIILMNLEEAKQSEYWPMFAEMLPLFGLAMVLLVVWLVMVYRYPGMIYVEVPNDE